MAALSIEGDELVVRLSPAERLAAFRGDLRVPIDAVRSVAVEPHPWKALRGLRAPGTGVPGVLAYGTRRLTGDRRDFAAILGRRGVVRVELDPPSPFARLLVSVTDPQATARAVSDASARSRARAR